MHEQGTHALARVLLVAISLQLAAGTPTSTLGNDVMVTKAFVDIYETTEQYIPMLATSDGGAAFASYRSDTHSPRVVKVDSEGLFEWFGECRIPAALDNPSFMYYPMTIAEGTVDGQSHIYVGGMYNPPRYGFVIEYKTSDGTFIRSGNVIGGPSGGVAVLVLLVDSNTGALIFGANYHDTGAGIWQALMGTLDRTTFLPTIKTLSTACSPLLYVNRVMQDPVTGNYIFAGECGNHYIWVGSVVVSTTGVWSLAWETHETTTVYNGNQWCNMVKLDSGKFAVLGDGDTTSKLFIVSADTHVVSGGTAFPGSYALTASPTDAGKVLIVGRDSVTLKSFAYYYDPEGDLVYNQGQIAQHDMIVMRTANKHPSYSNVVWVAGYLNASPSYGFLLRIQQVSPVSCSGTQSNYLNTGCFSALTTGCFGLCGSCYLPSNIDACAVPCSSCTVSHYVAAYLFAGRCSVTGTHYDSVAGNCLTVSKTSCHQLCGGECIGANSAAKCAHHCVGASIEPHVDRSGLASNICACEKGWAYSTATSKCAECHPFCDGCTETADSQKCLDCAHIDSETLVKTGVAVPYTCSCPDGLVYQTGMCLYSTGCHPLCSGMCKTQGDAATCTACVSSAVSSETESLNLVACSCLEGTLYDGMECVPILHVECDPRCGTGGCTVENDPTKCVDCGGPNVRSDPVGRYYRNCSCEEGTMMLGGYCVYTDGCDTYCNGCFVRDNSSSCLSCVTGITPQESASLGVVCACPNGTTYSNQTCGLVLNSTACSPLCNQSAGCVAAQDPSKCVSSCSSSSVVTEIDGTVVTCGCPNGTRLNSAGKACVIDVECDPLCDSCEDEHTCLACPDQGGEDMVLSDGRCICATGYVMSEAKCVKSSTTATEAMRYSGYVIAT